MLKQRVDCGCWSPITYLTVLIFLGLDVPLITKTVVENIRGKVSFLSHSPLIKATQFPQSIESRAVDYLLFYFRFFFLFVGGFQD